MPVKYLGSKRKLLPYILPHFTRSPSLPRGATVLDLFSGTARVGAALRESGYVVTGNDLGVFGAINARCYLEATPDDADTARHHFNEMDLLDPVDGYFTETFCRRSRFFTERNGKIIDAWRGYLAATQMSPVVRSIVTIAMIEAADRVDSTTGIQAAYLKQYADRAHNRIELRLPPIPLYGPVGKGVQGEASLVASEWKGDAAYLDPPYNAPSYASYYHIWETLARGDEPEVYGVACKRVDTRENKSEFNKKQGALLAFEATLRGLKDCKLVVVSYSNEGFIPLESMVDALKKTAAEGTAAQVTVEEIDYERYIGAKIGGSNAKEGRKLPVVTTNKEYILKRVS